MVKKIDILSLGDIRNEFKNESRKIGRVVTKGAMQSYVQLLLQEKTKEMKVDSIYINEQIIKLRDRVRFFEGYIENIHNATDRIIQLEKRVKKLEDG